jgi:hypothetical protein
MSRQTLPPCDWKAFPSAQKEELLYAYTTAMALCMLGHETPASITKVVRALGDSPTPTECEHYLVNRGVTVHAINPFDLNAFAKAEDGLGFIRDFYKPLGVWTKTWERFWADEVPRAQQKARDTLKLVRSKRNYSLEVREPTLAEVTTALDGTQVVGAMLRPLGSKKTELGMHPVVIHEWQPEQRQFLCYDPDAGSGVYVISLKEFRRNWLSEEGIIVLSH